MKLYEIAAEYQRFMLALEDGEIPLDALEDTLECITAELDEKADNIACMIKELTAEAEAIDAEIKALTERKSAKKARAERLKAYLSETLLTAGKTKVETARNKITFRKSESVKIEDEGAFVSWALKSRDDLLKYAEPMINKTALKDALKKGDEIEGAYIESKQNIQLK